MVIRPASGLPEGNAVEAESIAVVGLSCRFPGAADPDAFWRLLVGGESAVGPVPDGRPGLPADATGRPAGFLDRIDAFDPEFFGMTRREAASVDPQQRLVLELAWEALENAGIVPDALRETPTGVFVGAIWDDYAKLAHQYGTETVTHHSITGLSRGIIANRVSYVLGLRGPSLVVDTGQSSSLVAVQLACESLRRGEAEVALAGGVSLNLLPEGFVVGDRFGALSPDGRTYTFDERADGYVRGEGGGIVVLKTLRRAVADGDPVYCVIRGGAVNNDGGGDTLTAPRGAAQEDVLRRACAEAGVEPAAVRFVELHGTGTPVGDPIEAAALGAVLGVDRPSSRPLLVGSVKTNIGHLEGAAGIAGLIKAALCLRAGILVPSLNFRRPNPAIPLDELRIAVNTGRTALQGDGGGPVLAGVSSFGMGGTNCHLVLSDRADDRESASPPSVSSAPVVVPLSGRSPQALAAQADTLNRHLMAHRHLAVQDVAHSLATTRTHFEHRAVVVADDRAALLNALGALATGDPAPGLVRATAQDGDLAFLFTGQGSQRSGMGRELYEAFPVFAQALDAVCAHLDPELERPLRQVMFADPESDDATLLHRTGYTQPALFAYEVALYRLLDHWGIAPSVVLGHSVGELAAAHVAGVLSLPDAAALVAARGRLMEQLPEGGAMVSVQASEEEVRATLESRPQEVAVAAVNGPLSTVIAGDEQAVLDIAREWAERGRRTKRLRVSHAFHSPRMDSMLGAFRDIAQRLAYRAPTLTVVSNLTGRVVTAEEICDPEYWVRHTRDAVRFLDGMRATEERGVHRFLEVGPDAVLSAMGRDCVVEEARFVPTARAARPEVPALLSAVAELHALGVRVDWRRAATPGARVGLPTYAFQRDSYWLKAPQRAGDLSRAGLRAPEHPLLGAVVRRADADELLLTGRLSTAEHPWLSGSATLLPASVLLELVLATGEEVGATGVNRLTTLAVLAMPEAQAVRVQVAVGRADREGRRPVSVYAQPAEADSEGRWTRLAEGLLASPGPQDEPDHGLAVWPPRGATPDTRPALEGVRGLWRRGEELFAEVSLDETEARDSAATGHRLHPALLDGVFRAVDGTEIPHLELSELKLYAVGAGALRVRVVPDGSGAFAIEAADASGLPVLAIGTVRPRQASHEELRTSAGAAHRGDLHRLRWHAVPLPEDTAPTGPYAVLGSDPSGLSAALTSGTEGVELYPDFEALSRAAESRVPRLVLAPIAPAPADATAEGVHAAVTSVARLLRMWAAHPRFADSRLVVVTRGALAVGSDDFAPDLTHAPLCGLLRAAQAEHPGRFGLLDLGPAPESARHLAAALAAGEPELALRGGTALVPRLETVADRPDRPAVWESAGTVLITGGTGALGQLVARHLASEQGVRHLLLVSRQGLAAPGATGLAEELGALGVDVTVAECDVAERAELAALIAAIPADRPLTAVVHTAGVLDDATLENLDDEQITGVLRPKVDAALHLHELTRELNLSEFVLFSSITGTVGSPGQAAYAAANSFLDALAQRRRTEGLHAVSLAWGLWERRGQLTGRLDDGDMNRLARAGLLPLADADGLALFGAARAVDEPLLVPARFDREHAGAWGTNPVLHGLFPPRPRQAADAPVQTTGAVRRQGPLAERVDGLPEAERVRTVAELVRAETAVVLEKPSPASVDMALTFKELGFDSLTGVELRNRLGTAAGIRLPATLVFDHPTGDAVTQFLCSELFGTASTAAASQPTAPAVGLDDDPVVVIGMSSRLPGGINTPEQLWDLVSTG
ncbi:SDR family NAD(P)-dependent oxidoreductase, partial [Streptomyces sp. NPDC093568]|uniref:type I polyketide synthase n=1 Tax=Streptomyces sp. NPDC093568 TaxID=3366041 RepID=UPI00380F05A7